MRDTATIPRSIWFFAALPIVRFLAVDGAQGLDHLLYWFLSDDAFYTFEISKHIPEFNEGIPTSGFHPLYVMLIAPLHRSLAPELAVSGSLLLLVSCLSLGTVALYRMLARSWGRDVAVFCAAAWSVNGALYSVALTGLESTLAAFLVLVFFERFNSLDATGDAVPPVPSILALGGIAGVAFWARMDVPLLVAPAGAFLALRLLRRGHYLQVAALALPAVLIPLIWLAYTGTVTGNPFPDSSAALRNLRGLEGNAVPPSPTILRALRRLGAGIGAFFFDADPRSFRVWFVLGAFVAASAGSLVSGLRREGDPLAPARARLSGLILVGFTLWTSYYLLYLAGFRPWYFAYVGPLVFAAVVPPLVFRVSKQIPSRNARRAVGAVVVATWAWLTSPVHPRAPQEYDKYHAAKVADRFLDRHAVTGAIGAFNTGVYGYAMRRDVLNLDGVVNPEALAANRLDELPAYLARKRVRFLIEHRPDQAVTFEQLFDDPRVRVERWIDLSEEYPPFRERHAKRTYLWKVHLLDVPR